MSQTALAQIGISCPAATQKDDACSAERASNLQPVTVRVELDGRAAPGAAVTFRVTKGGGAIDTLRSTDQNGYATAIWTAGADSLSASVGIEVAATVGGRRQSLGYSLTMAPKPSKLAIEPRSGSSQSWFVSQQLRYHPRVRIIGAANSKECEGAVVVFKPFGSGEATPDSVRGRWISEGECQAQTRWKLGPTIGEQTMYATLAGSSQRPISFEAYSRKAPWLAAGFYVGRDFGYRSAVSSSRTIQVVAKSAAAETTFTSTIEEGMSVKTLGGWVVRPTIGINAPILTSLPRLRVSISADAQHVDRDWYGGISMPQLWNQVWNEGMGADIQLVFHVSKRDELENPGCESVPMTCRNAPKTTLAGIGLNLQLDASSLISSFASLLYPK